MPMLVKLAGGMAQSVPDPFVFVADDEPLPDTGDIAVSFARLCADGEALLASSRRVAVRLQPADAVEDLAYDLPRLAGVQLVFAKFRDGRPYSAAVLLRERLGFTGEIRAVGDVLREQAAPMVRCGFDAFEPADGSTAEQWLAAAHRYRHVYQRAADDRAPIFEERQAGASGIGHNRPARAGV